MKEEQGDYVDPQLKKKLPGLCLLSFSTFVVCVPAAFTQIISFDLMLDLNAFPDQSYAWTFPLFVAGECAAMGFCSSMIDRYGRKLPYLVGSILFIIAAMMCAMSEDMTMFLAFRLIQGFGAGLIIVTCIAQIYFDVPDPQLRYMVNGIMSLGFGVGMLFGIFAGKIAIDTVGWPVAFWIFAILQALVTYPALKVLENGANSEMKADVLGAVILMVWAGAFVYFLQKMYLDWSISDPEAMAGIAFLVMLFLIFLLVETYHPNSVFHRKVDNGKLVAASLVFIVLLGVIDMGAVGFMVKIAFFTYQLSVLEAAPFFIIMVMGAAITAVTISKTIHKTGHMPWFLLSAILSPIALLSMYLVTEDDPAYVFALHLFILGLAIGCLVSMLNATIQNRTNKDNNGAYMSFAIMIRTVSLWLGYNFYQIVSDTYMASKIGDTVSYWSEVIGFDLPSNSTLANLLVTPIGELIRLIPGLTDEIAQIFAQGVANGLMYGAIIFVVIALPVTFLLVGRRKAI